MGGVSRLVASAKKLWRGGAAPVSPLRGALHAAASCSGHMPRSPAAAASCSGHMPRSPASPRGRWSRFVDRARVLWRGPTAAPAGACRGGPPRPLAESFSASAGRQSSLLAGQALHSPASATGRWSRLKILWRGPAPAGGSRGGPPHASAGSASESKAASRSSASGGQLHRAQLCHRGSKVRPSSPTVSRQEVIKGIKEVHKDVQEIKKKLSWKEKLKADIIGSMLVGTWVNVMAYAETVFKEATRKNGQHGIEVAPAEMEGQEEIEATPAPVYDFISAVSPY